MLCSRFLWAEQRLCRFLFYGKGEHGGKAQGAQNAQSVLLKANGGIPHTADLFAPQILPAP